MFGDRTTRFHASAAYSSSFVRRLVGGIALVNLLIFGVVAFSLYQSFGEFEDRAEVMGQNLSLLLAQEIAGDMDKIDLTLLSSSDEIERQSAHGSIDANAINSFLERQQGRLPSVLSLRMTDANGIVRYGRGVNPATHVNNSDREYFIRQRDNPKAGLVIGKPITTRIDGKWAIPISRAIHLPDGSFGGVVYINVAIEHFVEIFSAIDVGRRGSVSLRDAELRILARYPVPADAGKVIGEPLLVPELEKFIRAGNDAGTYVTDHTVDGVERRFAVHKLFGHPLYIVVGRSTEEYMAQWRDRAVKTTLLAALFCLTTLVSSWLIYRNWRRQSIATMKLVAEEEKFHTVADYTYDWEYWEGPEREILFMSPSCERVTGYSQSEFQADPELLNRVIYADDRDLMISHRRDAAHAEEAVIDFRIVRRDGDIRWIEHGWRAVFGQDGKFIGRRASNRDITERKRAEEKARRLNRKLRAISICNENLITAEDEQTLLDATCRIICDEAGYRMAWVGFAEHDAAKSIRPVAWAGVDSGYIANVKFTWADNTELDQCLAGKVIRSGEAVYVLDFAAIDPKMAPWRDSALQHGYRSGIALPLKDASADVFGVLLIYSTGIDAISPDEKRLLEELAGDLAFGIVALRTSTERKRAVEKMAASELRYRRLFEAAKDGILILDAETGMVVDVNPFLLKMLGCPHDELIGKRIWELGFFKNFLANQDNFMELQRQEYTRHEDLPLEAADGRLFHVKIISNVFPMDGCRVIQCNIRDITERRQMGEQLRASEARYKRIAEGLTDYQYTVRVENGHAVATLQSQGCVTVTGYTPEDFAADPYLWIQLVAPEDRDRVKEHVQQILAGEHIPPIEYRINRKDGEDRWVSDTTILFKDASGNLQSYDGIIKDITERKTAEEQIQRYVAQLEDSFFRTVEVVTTLIEMRDPYTAGHERRVAELATAIGNELGLDARRIEGLRVAGQLHDIGKICLPAEILAKPGKITASEYTLIKEHSKAGYDVLKDVNFPWPVAEVAWQHHERMDGSGYPRGLKGDEILLEARIMSVADVVEAMASHRPYRPGLGIEAALGEIIGSRGTRYDPQVVDACVALFREQGYVFHN